MTKPRCFFQSCPAPVTFRVWRLWNPALPVQHCCNQHVPGILLGIPTDQLPDVHQPTGFYRVERIKGE